MLRKNLSSILRNALYSSSNSPLSNEKNLFHSNFLANNGTRNLDQAFYTWAVKILNPDAEETSILQAFENVNFRYDNNKRFFHRGLDHPRSLFPVPIQKIYKELYNQPENQHNVNTKISTDKVALAQEILAAFYHDVVHRNDEQIQRTAQPLTSSLLEDVALHSKVEVLSCNVAEEHFQKAGIAPKLSLPILLAIISTIPFSVYSEPKNLLNRLNTAARLLNLTFSPEEIHQSLLSAAALSNRDLGSYAEDNFQEFNQKTHAMMLERFPRIANEDHSLLEEIQAIKSFYDAHKGLLTKIQTNGVQVYQSVEAEDKEISEKNKIAIQKIQLDIIVQGLQLGSLMILVGALGKQHMNLLSKPLKHIFQHEAITDFLLTYSHLKNETEIPEDIIGILQNLNKPCVVNGITITRGLLNSEFTQYCLQHLGLEKTLQFADYSDLTNIETMLPQIEIEMQKVFKQHLILFVDINGTIMLADPVSGKDTITAIYQILSEKFVSVWGEHSQEEMSYQAYLEKYLCPGDNEKLEIKIARNQFYRNFISYLEKTNHSLLNNIKEEFEKIHNQFVQSNGDVMQSFLTLVKHLDEQGIPYSIVLRTFGKDLQTIVTELEKKGSLRFSCGMSVTDEGYIKFKDKLLKKPEDMLNFIAPGQHYACQDNHGRWKGLSHSHAGGKPFPVSKHKVSIFFDDHSEDKQILNVLCESKLAVINTDQHTLQKELIELGRIVPVDTYLANLDENYFIEKIRFAYQTPLRLGFSTNLSNSHPRFKFVNNNSSEITSGTLFNPEHKSENCLTSDRATLMSAK